MILTRRFPQYYDVERDDYIGKRIESCYLRSPPLKPKNSFKEFKGKALLDDFEDVEGEDQTSVEASHRGDEIRDIEKIFELANLQGDLDVYVFHVPQPILFDYYFKNLCVVFESDDEVTSIYKGNEKGKVLLDDIKSVGFGKGKVLLDDFEVVGNGKDKVDGDDSKDELISTKGDAPSRLSISSNTSFCQSQEMDYVDEKSTRVILGPAGRIHKLRNFKDDPTQDYIRKHLDDVDDDFKRRPWVTAIEFINDGGEIRGGYFGNIKSYIKNRKLKKVVAIITSCKPNVLGDMNVTLKDPSGTMSGTIHYKVLSFEDGYINDIKVGSALIIHNVSVFCPKS
ncbi:copia protein [Tanacetum coccineum]